MAELFKTIADSFTRHSEIYSSTEDAEQPKPTDKKEKNSKAAEPSSVEESATEESTEPRYLYQGRGQSETGSDVKG